MEWATGRSEELHNNRTVQETDKKSPIERREALHGMTKEDANEADRASEQMAL
jgi:hypothetical protein